MTNSAFSSSAGKPARFLAPGPLRLLPSFFILTSSFFILCGCATTGPSCYLTVANKTDAAVSNITIHANGALLYQKPSLAAKKASAYYRCRETAPRTVDLAWTGTDGAVHRQTVRGDKPVPADFHGRLFFEIEGPSQARCLVVPDPDDAFADMPWARPEKWEGFPAIPGLTGE
jgi:hypothetical protein